MISVLYLLWYTNLTTILWSAYTILLSGKPGTKLYTAAKCYSHGGVLWFYPTGFV